MGLVKAVEGKSNDKIIAGLEIKNRLVDELGKTDNGVNPKLKLSSKFSLLPINNSGGTDVLIDGKPLFKIM